MSEWIVIVVIVLALVGMMVSEHRSWKRGVRSAYEGDR